MSFPIQKNKNIIIIGDVMLDQFYYGDLEDTSKEDALAKILKVETSNDNLGGAGNVAMNIKSMGSTPYLISVVGSDASGEKVKVLCQEQEIDCSRIFVDEKRATTVKTRLYDEDQIIRFDQEDNTDLSKDIENIVISQFQNLIGNTEIDGVILQDYNKGVLNTSSIQRILAVTKKYNLPVFVDPKKANFFDYKFVTIFKPNLREINWALPKLSYQEASKIILDKINCEIAAITLSEDGIYFSSGFENIHFPSFADEIIDVCGAGDTVIAILALTYLSKCNISLMGTLSNLAAAEVCQSRGVVPINHEKLTDLCSSLTQDKEKYDIV